jgi:hypothetical protein
LEFAIRNPILSQALSLRRFQHFQSADVERARAEGADDRAIHDTVLIAAAFCMFNRYVEGLGTWSPEDPADYVESGVRLAEHGYAKFDFSKIRGEWPAEMR